MYIGQQFLQNVLGYSTVDAGLAILPAVFCMCWSRRVSQAGRGERRALHAPLRLHLRPAGLRNDAPAMERGHPTGRWRSATRSSASASASPAPGLALADRLCARDARRHGLGHGRPPARPRRRDHAVNFAPCSPPGYARTADAYLVLRQGRLEHTQAELTKSFSSAADTASRYPSSIQDQIIAGANTAFLQGDQWAYTAGSAPSCSERCSSTSSSRGRKQSAGCSPIRGGGRCSHAEHVSSSSVTSRADAEVGAVAVLVFVLVGLVSMPAWVPVARTRSLAGPAKRRLLLYRSHKEPR